MNHLFIVAHPDDEILGCCGTITRLKKNGDFVAIAVFSHVSATRESDLIQKCKVTHDAIGVDKTYFFDYEMMKFDTYDRYEMTQKVENLIKELKTDCIYTHDENDIHNDHRTLNKIVMEASKLPLRTISDIHPLSAVYTIEIPSSSDWGVGFQPNAFFCVDEIDVRRKADLLKVYDDVLRDTPHPRNEESFLALARFRGGQCGCKYAEAYKKVFELRR